MTNETIAPELQAEIDKQVTLAQIEALKTGDMDFGEVKVADGALMSEGNLAGSMQMSSDPGSRDKVTLYNTETGQPSRVLLNMLGKKLVQKLPNGKRAWSVTPTVDYFVGSTKCLLHSEHPRRPELDAMGLAGVTCGKSNIPSEFQVRQHMMHRHAQEWAVMEEARMQSDRDEDRAFRELQMEQWRTPAQKGA